MDKIEKPIFETSSLDLAAFLVLEDIKLLELTIKGKIVYFRFLDERSQCLDLERVFLSSTYKKYRDINKWLLKRVHEELKK
ncbi:MAG: hypothetical protein MOGMAGMI_00305 [Candidatus Omnitrophica bacterium]|nr:hypothetical protein [Candidatus Omnitrophota bacterium]